MKTTINSDVEIIKKNPKQAKLAGLITLLMVLAGLVLTYLFFN